MNAAPKRKLTIAVVFGGRSVEHDVSVVTGNQIIKAFESSGHEIVPVYITRDGRWYSGEALNDLNNYKNEITSHKGVEQVILSPATNHHGLLIANDHRVLDGSLCPRWTEPFEVFRGDIRNLQINLESNH